MKIRNRKTQKVLELNDSKLLKTLYTTKIGRILLKIIIKKPISSFNSFFIKSRLSKVYINKFIKANNIDMSEYEKRNYTSFDDFFTRKIKPEKRPVAKSKNELFAICDSKLSVYTITKDLKLNIKNSTYSLKELIKEELPNSYQEGKCLVFRLSADDYHHYYYLDDGKILKTKIINGVLHTVNPIAFEKYKVFLENQREVSYLKTKRFDEVIQIEVGALNIGKINNYPKENFKIAEEKGYFSFGASTVILLFKKDKIKIDADIENYSQKEIETRVLFGEKIGSVKNERWRKNTIRTIRKTKYKI